jgi:hypothetical protein
LYLLALNIFLYPSFSIYSILAGLGDDEGPPGLAAEQPAKVATNKIATQQNASSILMRALVDLITTRKKKDEDGRLGEGGEGDQV